MDEEIKPVYRCKVFEDADWIYLEKFPKERESFLIIETLYPAAAYEAQAHRANALALVINDLTKICTHSAETKDQFIDRVKAILSFDPDFRASEMQVAYEALQKENAKLKEQNKLLASSNINIADAINKHCREKSAQAKRISELEDRLSSFPIPTVVAMQKISKLRQEGFKEYAATVLNKKNQYCIVGDYGDVRWLSKNGE